MHMTQTTYETTIKRDGKDLDVAVTIETYRPPPHSDEDWEHYVTCSSVPLTIAEEDAIITEWLDSLPPLSTAAEEDFTELLDLLERVAGAYLWRTERDGKDWYAPYGNQTASVIGDALVKWGRWKRCPDGLYRPIEKPKEETRGDDRD